MPERLYQLRFGADFGLTKAEEMTPPNFAGLPFPTRPPEYFSSLTLSGRFVREAAAPRAITSPQEAADYLRQYIYTPFEQFDQEEVWVLLLNNKNYTTHEVLIYRGTINSALIRAVEVFKEAVRVNATGILLAHNHPSGDPTPSPDDVAVTRRIGEIATLLEIELADHLVIGKDTWVSLRSRGLGF